MDAHTPQPDATTRFSNRVADYVRHRPGYPAGVIRCLTREFGLTPVHVIADIGSGTGILTKMLLDNGNRVFAVEPNDKMRGAAEEQLAGFVSSTNAGANFISVAGSAEATTLAGQSVDWITTAQAFHWFDVDKARAEAGRILRPGGRVAVMWNDRKLDTPFLQAYEQLLLDFGTDFKAIRHEEAQTDGRLGLFFGGCELAGTSRLRGAGFVRRSFDNAQILDEGGLRGRTLSASYMPGPDHPRRAAMLEALHALFLAHEKSGRVALTYETRLYVGQFS